MLLVLVINVVNNVHHSAFSFSFGKNCFLNFSINII
jgi:hypothetical protein